MSNIDYQIQNEPIWKRSCTIGREEYLGYIYALFSEDNELLYIGQTLDIFARSRAHFADENKKDVFCCDYIQVIPPDMNEIEAYLILKYLPKYNKTIPKNKDFYTLDAYQKIDVRFYSNRVGVLRIIESLNIQDIHGYYKKTDLEIISEMLNSPENDREV